MIEQRKGWHTRGYLPHYDGRVYQFITFRLFDSMPQTILAKFQLERENGKLHQYAQEFQDKIEAYLDQGIGSCYLGRPEIAEMVRAALQYYDGTRYRLISWVIMPNHVHLLLLPLDGVSLSNIIKDLKGFTARRANKVLNREGAFWQADYFDRFIRDGEHFERTITYIEDNPVKAGLCGSAAEWKYSSAAVVKS